MAAAAHSPGFLAVVDAARKAVEEIPAQAYAADAAKHPGAALIDVREESEYAAGHVQGAEHIGKGVIERDIEKLHPDKGQRLYLYCGGGFRSALAGESLKKMGYRDVVSVDGGWKALQGLVPTSR